MNISFTGIKNIAFYKDIPPRLDGDVIKEDFDVNIGLTHPEDDLYYNDLNINVELTNDENGNDLDDYMVALKNSGLNKRYLNYINPNFLNINYKCFNEHQNQDFELNRMRLNAENKMSYPILTFIRNLCGRITKMENSQLKPEKEYLKTNMPRKGVVMGSDLKLFAKGQFINYDDMLQNVHNPYNVRYGAKIIRDGVCMQMKDIYEKEEADKKSAPLYY